MIELHPEIVKKDGKRFVLLSYEEFVAIQKALGGAEDLDTLRIAKKEEHDAPGVPLNRAVDELGLESLS